MENINKKELSERDICSLYIRPAVADAGWDSFTQIREEVNFTKGKVVVRGNAVFREKPLRADFILYYKSNVPLAIIEAKDNTHGVGDGMQQALRYAEKLQVPFVFSSNGDSFLEHDRLVTNGVVEREISLNQFPSPEELWKKYCNAKNISSEIQSVVTQDYYSDGSKKEPRYFQMSAINKTIEAIAKGQNRILLVMATGTGKTYTAFQIIWRLWKAKKKKRILFLADRNILVDQTMVNDFKPFGGVMTKITDRTIDKSYEVYMSLYQAITGPKEEQKVYKEFSPDFFDLIVIDECHRGSADEDSAWREILEYFSSATHIGLTATPKETEYISNIDYFGDPVFFYSLKEGIEDGFLAPYKVIRIDLDKDLLGWRPTKGQRDKLGQEIEDRIYNQIDFDKTLVLEKRTELVAQKITDFLTRTNRFDKTIVFCEDIDHAERMRQQLVNCNSDLVNENRKYVMKITGDDLVGKMELDNFILPDSKYPVIATTSKLMSTGIDAQTCKLIVIDQNIQSVSLFKQIIGRGTRINEDYQKLFFTIMDFRKATEHFSDPDFDGIPIPIDGDGDGNNGGNNSGGGGGGGGVGGEGEPRPKYYVNNVSVFVVAERVQFYDKDGKLVTESLKDYTRKNILKEYSSLDQFLILWNKSSQKSAIIEEMKEHGIFIEAMEEEVSRNIDPFDLVCHVAFDQPPLTRKERANNVKKRNYFTKYGGKAREILSALIDKYADEGIENIEDIRILRVKPIKDFGTPYEIFEAFGSKEQYEQAVLELEQQLYQAA